MTTAAASPLLFRWNPPRPRRRALVSFIIASVLLHALCFYIFQIVYPPTVALLPAPARVSVISPDDPESLALLRWVEAEDPALASATQRPGEHQAVALPKMEYVPSFARHEPEMKTIPQSSSDLTIPSSTTIGQTPRARTGAAAPSLARKTAPSFSDAASLLGTPILPEFTFHLSRADAPANARFRIAVDKTGAVRFCFLVESSSDPALDEQARKYLLLCRFPPPRGGTAARGEGDDALTWSIATILWGSDFAPLPSPAPAL